MAKVRVYELAKELSIDSKELVEKLLGGGMSIKNYMSTLDEDAVLKAKEITSGVISEFIEERRIKPTVIRRRRKIKKVEAEIPAAKAEEEAGKERVEDLKPEELQEEERLGEAVAGEGVLEKEGLPAQKAEPEIPVEEAKVKPKKTKKKKIERPARIIKRAEEGPLKEVLPKRVEKREPRPPAPRQIPVEPVKAAWEAAETVKPETPPEKGKKKKKEKAQKKEVEVRDTFRRRKREVYEKADLYAGRGPRRKGKMGGRRGKEVVKTGKQTEITVPKAIKRRIKVQETVTIAELGKAMGTKAVELIKRLMTLGVTSNINQPIDFESASVVADEFGYELELDTFEEEHLFAETEDRAEDLVPRPPVITIMGHVDHGKTSLLDYIRKSNIIGRESGGITQHIGAYYVKTESGDIVFLDTPGHEAFTAMRARGARVTDLIVLVVAADDGVMPQTKEAINHARAAKIPIVVAVNKIDKPEANPEKVQRELAELDLSPEEWGGDTIFGNISAKTGEGVDEFLSLLSLQSEMLELKGNPDKPARGVIIEAKLDKSKGPVATVLIKNGTLRRGDHFICGEKYGRVRAMLDQRGKKMKSAGPAMPAEIYGISGVPMAGDEFIGVQDEKTAKQVIEHRKEKSKRKVVGRKGLVSLDDLFERIKEGDVKELNIVLKTDVQGSLEAVGDSLVKQSTEEVKLNIIHSATGAITESDVMLASASGAIIIGFNVRVNPRVSDVAEKENVDIRYYDVIYNVVKDIRLAMAGLLEPIYKEHVIGRADVKEVFRIPKVGSIAGCYVTDGHVVRNANVRLLRDDVVIFDGKLASLRRFKEDAKEVQNGYECGIGLENFQDIKSGDVFEVYEIEEVEAEL
ncbi:MAG: translation initiation factor IF-2 [Desulfobacteraceae bacterium]|nr:MAG: translation initiation factor IF-2 [Desulfobacteraceae bacterium]